jgi:transcriptional regulator with XRE-family HTH domain
MPTVLNTERLQQLIQQKFGSQVEFAKACGVSKQYIGRIWNGEDSPSLERIIQFANLLGVSIDELIIRDYRGN